MNDVLLTERSDAPPLLSIGIPTYNGSIHIRETLDSFLPSLNDIDAKVEVFISDNASTDGTPDIIREYLQRYNIIKYVRNEENIGYDRNCDAVFKGSSGLFVWLLSDNDRISKGGVERVLEVVKEHPNLAAIYVDYVGDTKLNSSADVLCPNGDVFFDKTAFKVGLMSCNVIRRSLWNNVDTSKYFDGGWIHFGVLIEILGNREGFVIATPYLTQRISKDPGDTWFKNPRWASTLSLNLTRMIRSMKTFGYSDETIKKGLKTIRAAYLINFPLMKVFGLKVDRAILNENMEIYGDQMSFYLVGIPLLLVPGSFYKIVYSLIYPFRRKVKRIILGIKD
jgi:glycosyltransferase involved in cell wall biosynthesis